MKKNLKEKEILQLMWSETKIRKSTLNKHHKIWEIFLWLKTECFASDFSDNEVFKFKNAKG